MSNIPIDARGGRLPDPRMEPWSKNAILGSFSRKNGEEQRAKFHTYLNPEKRLSLNNKDGANMVSNLINLMEDPRNMTPFSTWTTRLRTDPVGQYLVDEWMPDIIKRNNYKFGVNKSKKEVSQLKRVWMLQNLQGLHEALSMNSGMQTYDPVKWAQTYDDTSRARGATVTTVQEKILEQEKKKIYDKANGIFMQEPYEHEMATLNFNLEEATAQRDKALRDYQQKVLRIPSNEVVTMTRKEMDARFDPQMGPDFDLVGHINGIRESHDSTNFNQNLTHYLKTQPKGSNNSIPEAIGALYHLSFNMDGDSLGRMAMALGVTLPQAQEGETRVNSGYDMKNLDQSLQRTLYTGIENKLYAHVNDLGDQVGLGYGTINKIKQGLGAVILYQLEKTQTQPSHESISSAINELINKHFVNSVVADVANSEALVVSAGALTGENSKLSNEEIQQTFSSFGDGFQNLQMYDNFQFGANRSYERQFKFLSELTGEAMPKTFTAPNDTKARNILTNLGNPNHLAFTQNKRFDVPAYAEVNGKEIKFLEVSKEQYKSLSPNSKNVLKESLRDEHVMTSLMTQLVGDYQLKHAFGSVANKPKADADAELSALGLSDTKKGRELLKKIQEGEKLGTQTSAIREETNLRVNSQILKEHVKLTRIGNHYAFTYLHPKDNTLPHNRVYLKNKNGKPLMFTADEIANAVRSAKHYQKRMQDMVDEVESERKASVLERFRKETPQIAF